MLKYENLANVGDKIRAYDFMGNREAYIEGTVIEKGDCPLPYYAYSIKIEKDGAGFGREGDIGYVPFENAFLEYDGRVELIDWDNRAEEELAIAMMKEVA